MEPQVIFYNKIVSLNPQEHKHLKFKPTQDFGFSSRTNSVPVAAVEFAELCKEFPIAFAKSGDGEYVPVAVLGLSDGENLFVGSNGAWDGRYVPAFIRRYPFVPAESNDDRLIICFDEACAGFNETDGEPLLVDGEPSTYLRQIISFVQDFHAQSLHTKTFVSKLSALGLLIERHADAVTPDGQRYRLSGLWVVDEAAFRNLPQETVYELFSSGELALVYLHLVSLGNFNQLLTRKQVGAGATKH
jgi:hypothetical protein